jgi:hypothetical protein
MKERVVFQTNVPVTAALTYADGIKVEGRYGDQVMYSLTDERVMYVPPVVGDKLIELGIRQNQAFSICKAECGEGNRRFIEWTVKRIATEQPCAPAPANGDNYSAVVESSAADTQGSGAGGNGTARPNGKAAVGPPNGSNSAQATLRAALAASIDAAIEAERSASEHGLSVRFGRGDLRAMALSLFILHARGGGVR